MNANSTNGVAHTRRGSETENSKVKSENGKRKSENGKVKTENLIDLVDFLDVTVSNNQKRQK